MAIEFASGDGFDDFYELTDPISHSYLRLATDQAVWPLAEKLAKGKVVPEQPLQYRHHMGGKLASFLWASLLPLVCVRLEVVDLLQSHGFTGWSTYPVEVVDRNEAQVPGYAGFSITGPDLAWDRSKSSRIIQPPIVPAGISRPAFRGLYFDRSQWDGSDFFWTRGASIVTDRAMKAMKRAKFTNVRFNSLHEIEIPESHLRANE